MSPVVLANVAFPLLEKNNKFYGAILLATKQFNYFRHNREYGYRKQAMIEIYERWPLRFSC